MAKKANKIRTEKPDCTKSQPCGLGCISVNKTCREQIGLDDSRAELLSAYESFILEHIGLNEETGKQEFRRNADAFVQSLTTDEKEYLQKRKEILDENKTYLIKETAESLGVNGLAVLTQEESDYLYERLPANIKTGIEKAGGVGTAIAWPQDEPNIRKKLDKRAKAIFKLWLDQGGRDGYTLGDKVFSLDELDLEHITPMSVPGGLGDKPENWTLIRTGLNLKRKATPLPKFVENAGKPEKVKKTKEEGAENQKDLYRKIGAEWSGDFNDYKQAPGSPSDGAQGYIARGLGLNAVTSNGVKGRSYEGLPIRPNGRAGSQPISLQARDAFVESHYLNGPEKTQDAWHKMGNAFRDYVGNTKQEAEAITEIKEAVAELYPDVNSPQAKALADAMFLNLTKAKSFK